MQIQMQLERFVMERDRVINREKRSREAPLKRALAFIRRRARTRVLRRRKRVSTPGSPPSVRSRDSVRTLKNIRFAIRPGGVGVVGPLKFSASTFARVAADAVPGLLEHGGPFRIIEERSPGGADWVPVRRSRRPGGKTERRVRNAKIRPRPFMSVALRQELDAGTIPKQWEDAVR